MSSSSSLAAVHRLRGGVAAAGLTAALLAVAAVAAERKLDLGGLYIAIVLAAFVGGAAVALRAASFQLDGAFGAANQITLLRGGLVSLASGLVIADASAPVLWFAIAAAGSALVLDGVDGSLARRRRCASRFGARFDMETDALTTLVLAVLVWRFDKAGAWVLASGLMRYAFVAAGCVWPRLGAPLPPSRRRQAVCVVQIAALLVCLAPFVAREQSAAIAAAALALLGTSFAVDAARLASTPRARTR